jgi:hypothetical protein
MNFPACTLLGGPFTSLAVTQNYRSNLHAEPKEHPFSYIAWLDVLSKGSTMEVGGARGGSSPKVQELGQQQVAAGQLNPFVQLTHETLLPLVPPVACSAGLPLS